MGSSGEELDLALLSPLKAGALSSFPCRNISSVIILCKQDLAHFDYALTSAYEQHFSGLLIL